MLPSLKIRSFLLVLVTTLLLGYYRPCAQGPAAFTVNKKSIHVSSFDARIEKMRNEMGIPGISLAIIDKNRVVYSKAYGYKTAADKLDSNAVFEAASLSKSFLVYVVYKLVDEGKFDLNKPLYQYLANPSIAYDPRYRLITGAMVLSHSSGLENWKSNNRPDTLEIVSNPGEKYVYSGEGYNYLARVVETILGKPYEKYVREMIIQPLDLHNTFMSYDGDCPSNYAIGHDSYGKSYPKSKNASPIPSSGMHLTAGDYASLIVSFFDKKHISGESVRNMLRPVVQIYDDNKHLHYGKGFEVLAGAHDTIILHGGNNDGFRAIVCYSVVSEGGFVLLTNSDRGALAAKYVCQVSTGLNIDEYYHYEPEIFTQYPSNAITLFKVYRDSGAASMLHLLEEIVHKTKGDIGVNTLNELAWLITQKDSALSIKLLERNILLYPAASTAYYILGLLQLESKDVARAHKNLTRARDLHFKWFGIDEEINKAGELLRSK